MSATIVSTLLLLDKTLTLVNVLIPLVSATTGLSIEAQKTRALIKKMIAENRDPTKEEWDELDAGIAALEDRIINRDN